MPIILMKRIEDIRDMFESKIAEAEQKMLESKEVQEANNKHSDSE